MIATIQQVTRKGSFAKCSEILPYLDHTHQWELSCSISVYLLVGSLFNRSIGS